MEPDQPEQILHLGCAVESCSFAPTADSNRLATSSDDGTVQVWLPSAADSSAAWSSAASSKRHEGLALAVAWSPDATSLCSAGEDKRVVVGPADLSASSATVSLEGHTDIVCDCAFSASGDLIASASADKTTRLWDVRSGELVRMLVGHGSSVLSCGFSPDGLMIVTTEEGGLLKLWEVAGGGELQTLGEHLDLSWVTSCAWHPTDGVLASGSWEPAVHLWHHPLLPVTLPFDDNVTSIAFAPRGATLAIGFDNGTAQLWNTTLGSEANVATFEGCHTDEVNCVAWSHGGELLATAAQDGTVALWSVGSGHSVDSVAGAAAPPAAP